MEAQLERTTEDLVEFAFNVRREKDRQFGKVLSADPGWDMLLQLYRARLRGRTVQLACFSGEFPLSALARWARLLDEQGLVEWSSERLIGSDHSLRLSEMGAVRMSQVFRNPASRSICAWR